MNEYNNIIPGSTIIIFNRRCEEICNTSKCYTTCLEKGGLTSMDSLEEFKTFQDFSNGFVLFGFLLGLVVLVDVTYKFFKG